ncbi:helix-turn-helix domain-containing protein [Parabacteroides johnsonii]|uniref:helix-turn-helix domain-containing protein n=1 Tax=Parabacteroides johnsonii TaxID=387661 RepID=UPI002672A852|nr:helix-turn-helix domain-containing protein [Parabacteroides johnsonii]
MEKLRERKTLSPHRMDIVEGDLYFNTGKYYQALKFYKRALESDSVKADDKLYMEQVHRMISSYDCLHDELKKADYVKLLLQKAKACGNKEMESIALFNMGKMIYYQEDKKQGYELMNEAIELMKNTDYKYKYDNLRYNYNTLLIMQQRDNQYEKALKTLDLLEEIVTKDMEGTTDIGSLTDKEKKTMYAQRALILSRLGRMQEADEAYRAWLTIGDTYSKDDYLIIPYLMDRKLYDKVIEMNKAHEDFLYTHNDTVTYHMRTIKRSLGDAYEKKKEYKEAAKYFKDLAILIDSLKVREQKSSALELAKIYETHEKDMQIKEQKAKLEEQHIILVAILGVLFLAGLAFYLVIRHLRAIKRKNRFLARQIDSQLAYREELHKANEEIKQLLKQQHEPSLPIASGKQTQSREKEEDYGDIRTSAEDKKLFEELDRLVEEDKLFLDPNISRELLLNQLHISKNTFAQLIQAYSGTNFSGYINNKRLDYSIHLLKDYKRYTIEAVATDSGFSNVRSFYRIFREKYGMTPSEYRNTFEKE